MSNKLDISVVVPLYNEEESLPELVAWIDRVAQNNKLSYEVIIVDDGSSDNSWAVVEQLKEQYPAIKGIRLHATTVSLPHCTVALPRLRERWSSRWTPTYRTRPTRFPRCAV